jgi:hypothetical protein
MSKTIVLEAKNGFENLTFPETPPCYNGLPTPCSLFEDVFNPAASPSINLDSTQFNMSTQHLSNTLFLEQWLLSALENPYSA